MKTIGRSPVLAAMVLAVASTGAPAQSHHHDRHRAAARHHAPHDAHRGAYPDYGYDDPRNAPAYGGYGWQGEAIREATERAQHEPGLTRELAPDSRQTATGGPVGGVPGFSGR